MIDYNNFLEDISNNNIVVLERTLLADSDTPLSVYLKISIDVEYSFLLESVENTESIGRYSFIGIKPFSIFKTIKDKYYYFNLFDRTDVSGTDPIKKLKSIFKQYTIGDDNKNLIFNGAVGYIGHGAIKYFEEIDIQESKDNIPEIYLQFLKLYIIYDHFNNSIRIINLVYPEEGSSEDVFNKNIGMIDGIIEKLNSNCNFKTLFIPEKGESNIELKSNFGIGEFEEIVTKAKKYIYDGDIFQVVLSQRFNAKYNKEPLDLYRCLRYVNPSPYMFFIRFKDLFLVGSSPEIMVKVDNDTVTVRPIAGTRKRGKTDTEDKELIDDLLSDEKECAEHAMLVDLGRNDIGRICKANSISLDKIMYIEKYSHVIHIVSNVDGTLRDDVDLIDVIAATFPTGTVSGAPKIRALEIIDELESIPREIYSGAVGYIGYNNCMDLAIIIRTIVLNGDELQVQVGAGIVADSDPVRENQETRNKAKAMMTALNMVLNQG